MAADLPFESLAAACISLAQKASSAAAEIDNVVVGNDDAVVKTELDKLSLLSSGLCQLSHHANRLQARLRDMPVLSPEAHAITSALLQKSDRAVGRMAKQVMRLDSNTPRQLINLPAISQYESFVTAVTTCHILVAQILSM